MFPDIEKNVSEFGFIPGSLVADFGSGAGHYALALSRLLGPQGRVYAIDLQEDILIRITREAEQEGRENIRVILGDIEKPRGTLLKDASVDGVIFSNILFQLMSKEASILEASRILKPGGRVCLVEWSDLSLLPRSKVEGHDKPVSKEEVKSLFLSFGFNLEREFEAGDTHYGLIFKKP